MGRYNGRLDSKFEGCMIVGHVKDEGRSRLITCYAIPEEPAVVGLYDGIDAWVGSALTFPKDVRDRLDDVHVRGLPLEIESGQTRRRLHDMPGVMGDPYVPPLGASRPRVQARTPPARVMANRPNTTERRRAQIQR